MSAGRKSLWEYIERMLRRVPTSPCAVRGHQWHNEHGGVQVVTSTGESVCYRCGHRENRGDDPASWFDYPGDGDSWGTLNVDKIPEGASLRSGRNF